MLEAHIAQQASHSSLHLGRIPSKPYPNPREHRNCVVLRSKLEGSQGARIKEDDAKNHGKSNKALPSNDENQEKN